MKANEGACKGEHQKLWGECYQVTWEIVHLRVRARSAAQVRCNYSAAQPAHLATHMRSHTGAVSYTHLTLPTILLV